MRYYQPSRKSAQLQQDRYDLCDLCDLYALDDLDDLDDLDYLDDLDRDLSDLGWRLRQYYQPSRKSLHEITFIINSVRMWCVLCRVCILLPRLLPSVAV